jgi:GAF domain-containing protein
MPADGPACAGWLAATLADAATDTSSESRAVSLTLDERLALLVPLRTGDTLVGHLCLGPKASGEPFSAEDQDLLSTLGGHLAAIMRNLRLVADLRAKVAELEALH